jgi:hypothetical protein
MPEKAGQRGFLIAVKITEKRVYIYFQNFLKICLTKGFPK